MKKVKTMFDGRKIYHDLKISECVDIIGVSNNLFRTRLTNMDNLGTYRGYYINQNTILNKKECINSIRKDLKHHAENIKTGEFILGGLTIITERLNLDIDTSTLYNNLMKGNRQIGDWLICKKGNTDLYENIKSINRLKALDKPRFKYAYDGYEIMENLSMNDIMEMTGVCEGYLKQALCKLDTFMYKDMLVSQTNKITQANAQSIVSKNSFHYAINKDKDMTLGSLESILQSVKPLESTDTVIRRIGRDGYFKHNGWTILRGRRSRNDKKTI